MVFQMKLSQEDQIPCTTDRNHNTILYSCPVKTEKECKVSEYVAANICNVNKQVYICMYIVDMVLKELHLCAVSYINFIKL